MIRWGIAVGALLVLVVALVLTKRDDVAMGQTQEDLAGDRA